MRRKQALDLRCAGASYRLIGETLDVSRQQAHRDVTRALRNLAKLSEEDAEAMRTLEEYRLNKMLRGLWPAALKGHQGAVDRVLRIMDRRARYLGLDAPKALDIKSGGKPLANVIVIIEHGTPSGDTDGN